MEDSWHNVLKKTFKTYAVVFSHTAALTLTCSTDALGSHLMHLLSVHVKPALEWSISTNVLKSLGGKLL